MDADKYNQQICLRCPTCGGSQFAFDDEIPADERTYKCVACERELTKDELMQENNEYIAEHQKEMVGEIKKDFAKDMRDNLNKAFRGSKNIKFK